MYYVCAQSATDNNFEGIFTENYFLCFIHVCTVCAYNGIDGFFAGKLFFGNKFVVALLTVASLFCHFGIFR